jgi:hypothetical protein
MSAVLRVTRDVGFGLELRRGRFEVLVDGKNVGALDADETVEAAVEPGPHRVRVSHGRYSSGDQSFDAAEGDVVGFRCHGVKIWPLYLASIILPNQAITLRRD